MFAQKLPLAAAVGMLSCKWAACERQRPFVFESILEALRKRIGDTAVVTILIVGFVVTISWVLYTFFIGQSQSNREAYYQHTLAACEDITKTVGRLVTAGPDEDLSQEVRRFEEMKYGELRLFESKELERAMVRFRTKFGESEPGPQDVISSEMVHQGFGRDPTGMQLAGFAVSDACRQMIEPTLARQLWGLLFRPAPDSGSGAPVRGPTPGVH